VARVVCQRDAFDYFFARRSRRFDHGDVNVPPRIWEAKLQEAQLPAHLIAHLITMAQLHRDNRYDRMTDSFQQLVGRAPISAAEFARRHAAAFTPG
jgi:hypothetical protein